MAKKKAKDDRINLGMADDAHDETTCDLLTQRMQVHEKTAWMLRANLG